MDKRERLTKPKEFKSLMCPIGCDHRLRLSFNVSRVINSTLSCFPVQSPLPTGCVSDFNCVRCEPLRLCAMRHRHTSDFSLFFFGISRLFHNSRDIREMGIIAPNSGEQRWIKLRDSGSRRPSSVFLLSRRWPPSTEHSDVNKSQTYPHSQGSIAGMLLSSNLFWTFAQRNSASI